VKFGRPWGSQTERAIRNNGDVLCFAPWNDRVLDRPFLQMVKHLIAGEPPRIDVPASLAYDWNVATGRTEWMLSHGYDFTTHV
jgi:hypothetical protein